jgi:hypothetical protein
MAKAKGCDGIICGHIHKAENREIDGIQYLNSGDWVETMSALAEDHDGNWQLIYYNEINFKEMHDDSLQQFFIGKPETTIIPMREVSFEKPKDDLDPPAFTSIQ